MVEYKGVVFGPTMLDDVIVNVNGQPSIRLPLIRKLAGCGVNITKYFEEYSPNHRGYGLTLATVFGSDIDEIRYCEGKVKDTLSRLDRSSYVRIVYEQSRWRNTPVIEMNMTLDEEDINSSVLKTIERLRSPFRYKISPEHLHHLIRKIEARLHSQPRYDGQIEESALRDFEYPTVVMRLFEKLDKEDFICVSGGTFGMQTNIIDIARKPEKKKKWPFKRKEPYKIYWNPGEAIKKKPRIPIEKLREVASMPDFLKCSSDEMLLFRGHKHAGAYFLFRYMNRARKSRHPRSIIYTNPRGAIVYTLDGSTVERVNYSHPTLKGVDLVTCGDIQDAVFIENMLGRSKITKDLIWESMYMAEGGVQALLLHKKETKEVGAADFVLTPDVIEEGQKRVKMTKPGEIEWSP